MKILTSIGLVLVLLVGCGSGSSNMWQQGSVLADPINEVVDFELFRNLIVVPVEIEGEVYRFIWDTGAATAISTRLQRKFGFRTIKRTTITDSQKNQARTRFVRVKELSMGKVKFSRQAAIVLDFEKHPVLACMDLDGIIGRNTHRLCNWRLDYQAGRMTITNQPVEKPEGGFEASFTYTDNYDIKLDLSLGKANVTNIKFDTGFTGGVSLPNKIFQKWIGLVELDTLYQLNGYQQSGLMGIAERSDTYFAFSDSLTLGSFLGRDVEVKSGAKGLVGNELWSQFVLTLDWQNKKLYGVPAEGYSINRNTWGFSISWDEEKKQAYILQVLAGSQAEQLGVQPLMVVEQIGRVDFAGGASFCDYLDTSPLNPENPETVALTVRDSQGEKLSFIINKSSYY